MIRRLIRLAVLPLRIVLVVLEYSAACILRFAGMLCRLLSGTIFLLTAIAFFAGIATGPQAANTLLGGLLLYLIPQIVGGCIVALSSVVKALSAL